MPEPLKELVESRRSAAFFRQCAASFWVVSCLMMLVLGGSVLRLKQAGNTVDDAYITFRHTENLLAGRGLLYNPEHPVLGTSSPAYALLLAGLARLSGSSNLPTLALWLNTVIDAFMVLAMFCLVDGLVRHLGLTGRVAALAAAGLLALDGKIVDFSTGGMESSLFAALLLGVALLLASKRTSLAAVLAGCSVWVRPDGGLIIAALLLTLWISRRQVPFREGLLAVLPVGMAVLAFSMTYGDPLPASLRAKAAGVYLLPADHALRYLCRHLAGMADPRLPLGRILEGASGTVREYLTLAASSVVPVGLMTAAFRRHRPAGALFVGLYALSFFVAFAAANPFMMGWYYVPLETCYLLLLCLGAAEWVAGFRSWAPGWIPSPAVGSAVLGLILLSLLVRPQAARYDWLPGSPHGPGAIHSEWEKVRERDYLRVGRDLRLLTGGHALLAGPEIGALGYAYTGPVLDTMGLVSPEARAFHPVPASEIAGNSAIPPDLIAAKKPDLVVFLEIFGRNGLLRDPRFNERYHLWRRYPSRVFGSRDLLVFVKNGAVW